jgi:DNA-directed RNA polymerase alpha subunit
MTDEVSQKAIGHLGAISKLIYEQRNIINSQRIEINRLQKEIERITGEIITDEPYLTERAHNCLANALHAPYENFHPKDHIDAICGMSEVELHRVPNLGRTTMTLIKRWLKYHGRELAN